MIISSPAFNNGESIPRKYSCDDQDISPELHFSDIPQNAKSLVLIVDDPDVPIQIRLDGIWDHWLVWNIPPDTSTIMEGSKPSGVIGINTSGKVGYQGPCPPDKEHRYFFKLYALDATLDLPDTADKKGIESAMEGHVIDKASLMGKYNRN